MENLLEIINKIDNTPVLKALVATVMVVGLFILLKMFLNKQIGSSEVSELEKIQLKRKLSRYLTILFLVVIVLLWFTQFQVFLVSLLAVAAAIVIAFKELIMCFLGGILINVSSMFKVGDRIQVDDVRGFVIEKNLLTTKILEIGPERNSQQTTGNIISLPNSLMLAKSVKNESYFKGFAIKSFLFKADNENQLLLLEKDLKERAKNFCKDYLEEAKEHMEKLSIKEGIQVPSVNPKTKIILENGKEFAIVVKLPVKNSEVADAEQELNRFYLKWRAKNSIPTV